LDFECDFGYQQVDGYGNQCQKIQPEDSTPESIAKDEIDR